MQVAIVAHTSRATQAADLQALIGGVMFLDDGRYGAAGNHHRALKWAGTQNDRVWVLEDDAIPSPRFRQLAHAWVDRFPENLISGYLGTSHPAQWMRRVDEQWSDHPDHVRLPQLIHGVAYSLPSTHIAGTLARLDRTRPADFGIGDAWHNLTGRNVIYPKASLVDHADGEGIANPGKPRSPRRARQLAT